MCAAGEVGTPARCLRRISEVTACVLGRALMQQGSALTAAESAEAHRSRDVLLLPSLHGAAGLQVW
jgi:hypothetical protein